MEPAPSQRACPACGQKHATSLDICPHCGRDQANPFVSPATIPKARRIEWRWIAPLALAILGLAVLVAFIAPGVSIAILVAASPILARALVAVERRREAGLPVGRHERLHSLLISTGIVILTGLAAAVAFTAVCFPISLPFFTISPRKSPQQISRENLGMFVAFASGGIAGLVAGFFVMRWFWPKKIPSLPPEEG
jgi:tetrahydromethanopterin S-methyltransferase subunit F